MPDQDIGKGAVCRRPGGQPRRAAQCGRLVKVAPAQAFFSEPPCNAGAAR